jgi:catechol 2,3-dioxygenase-like lactoylglutathione lyase family enzyme
MPDGRRTPAPGGWNRIHLIVDDIASEVERLRDAGLSFRNDIVSGPGGQQILLEDPSGNPIELRKGWPSR